MKNLRYLALGAAVMLSACSDEEHVRTDSRDPDPVKAMERILGDDGIGGKLMAAQFRPGKTKFDDKGGPSLPEGYTPPDFDKLDLGGMGMNTKPSFGVHGQLNRVILPPGYGPEVVIDAEGRVGVKVPAETKTGKKESEAKK